MNKVFAVRILHIPTGLFVRYQGAQLQNKKKAMALLMAKLLVIAQEQPLKLPTSAVTSSQPPGQSNPQLRLHPYQMVKDLRTQHETTDVQGVMDGDLDPFIQSLLHAGVEVAGATSDD